MRIADREQSSHSSAIQKGVFRYLVLDLDALRVRRHYARLNHWHPSVPRLQQRSVSKVHKVIFDDPMALCLNGHTALGCLHGLFPELAQMPKSPGSPNNHLHLLGSNADDAWQTF